MQLAPTALLCLLSAGAVAMAAEPTPAPPTQPPLALPGLTTAPPPPDVPATAAPHAADQPKPKAEASHRFEPPHGRQCFNAADTRDKIAAHRLTDPFRALRAARFPGEALRTRLCRWKTDEFIYEISVLRRDGRLVHVYMNAQSGQAVGAPDSDHK